MAGTIALVDYTRCLPEDCGGGVCSAALACSHKQLIQLEPYEMPMMNQLHCLGCGDCARACTQNVIRLGRM